MEGISICITAYKAQDFIKETLDSIENQTWFKDNNEFEILVGVDYCTDTLNYIKAIQHNYRNLRVFMMDSNMGTYVTSNTLIKIAKYDNIIRFDSDDIMLPNMVEYIMKNKGSSDIYSFYLQNFGKNNNKYLSDGVCFFRRNFMLKYGGFQPWKCAADSEMKKRLKNFSKHNKTREILFLRRVHDQSLTRKDGDTKRDGKIGTYRKEKVDYVNKIDIKKEEDAIIKMETNTFKEIFSERPYEPVDLSEINKKINEIFKHNDKKPVIHVNIRHDDVSDNTKKQIKSQIVSIAKIKTYRERIVKKTKTFIGGGLNW